MLIKYVNNNVCVYIETKIHADIRILRALCVAAYVHRTRWALSRSQIEVNTQHFVNTKDDQNNTLGYI